MQRRKLVVTAGVLSVTAFAATVAIGANFGLVGRAEPDSPVGRLEPQTTQPLVTSTGVPTSHPPTSTVRADD